LRIEVVHPVEPEIVPGARMEVGELVDGFQGLPPPLPPLRDVMWTPDENWMEALPPLPSPPRRRPVAEVVVVHPSAAEPDRRGGERGRWFGFDGPRRDYQAERAARRARLEALDRQAWEERDARRREWAARREDERRRDEWRDDRRFRDAAEEDARAGDFAERESFTALQ
jgi:hypothetical protein